MMSSKYNLQATYKLSVFQMDCVKQNLSSKVFCNSKYSSSAGSV